MTQLRIATWNLDHASNSSRPIAAQVEILLNLRPDIIVLTETCTEVSAQLERAGFATIDSRPNEYGKRYVSIHLGRRVSCKGRLETCDDLLACSARIDSPIGDVTVYGLIITYGGYRGPNTELPPWAEHCKAIQRFGDDWSKLSDRAPMLVVGDFNQTRDGSSRTYGTREGRRLLGVELDRNRLDCLTIEDFGAKGMLRVDPAKGWARHNIDHICATRDAFRVAAVGAWDHFDDVAGRTRYLSDHNGVYVDLEGI
jgi:endonuclease/exonuclease/phosphatase family metal-dependent hydrolase